MGWSASSRKDLVTLTLAITGFESIRGIVNAIDEADWKAAYRHERLDAARVDTRLYKRALKQKHEPPSLYYQNIYMLLKALEREGRVVRGGKEKGAWQWRALTLAEREVIAERARAALVPPPELVAEVDRIAERLGYVVRLRTDFEDGIAIGVVEITTDRGCSDWTFGHDAATGLTDRRAWRPALEELGLL